MSRKKYEQKNVSNSVEGIRMTYERGCADTLEPFPTYRFSSSMAMVFFWISLVPP